MKNQIILFKAILFILIGMCIVDIFNATDSYIWTFYQLNMSPDYVSWVGYIIIDIILITLLAKKKLRLLGLIAIILYQIYGLNFLYDMHGLNPKVWFHNGSPIQGVFIFIWIGEIILAFVGIFLWWKIKKNSDSEHILTR